MNPIVKPEGSDSGVLVIKWLRNLLTIPHDGEGRSVECVW